MGLTRAQRRFVERNGKKCHINKLGKLYYQSSRVCKHGRIHAKCKLCGGSGICEHNKQRHQCKACHGSSICQHGKRKDNCHICRPMSVVRRSMRNAKNRGLVWELTDEQAKWLLRQRCAYCGIREAAGIDRAKNEYGYTVLNSVPCCFTCNALKSNRTIKAFIIAVNAASRYCPTYPTFKRRWTRIRKRLEGLCRCFSTGVPSATRSQKGSKHSHKAKSRSGAPVVAS